MNRIFGIVAATCLATIMGCRAKTSANGGAVHLTGAGSTFINPLMQKWASDYGKSHPDVKINYQSIGSGGGIRQFTEKTVNFGATDGPLTEAQMQKVGGETLHIPAALGAVIPVYNLPNVHKTLVFNGETLADMYLGRITKWNDPKLKALNPTVDLPDMPVTIVHRADGSGTTYIWTDYLSKVSKDWSDKVGHGTAVDWPVGMGGKGNEGVTGVVNTTPGSLGYVELIYALSNKLAFGDVVNAAGKTIHASIASVSAALGQSVNSLPADLRFSFTNAAGDQSYPVSGCTWLLVRQQLPDTADSKAMVQFFWWAVHVGQTYSADLHYAPLPPEVVARCEEKLKSITIDGKPVTYP